MFSKLPTISEREENEDYINNINETSKKEISEEVCRNLCKNKFGNSKNVDISIVLVKKNKINDTSKIEKNNDIDNSKTINKMPLYHKTNDISDLVLEYNNINIKNSTKHITNSDINKNIVDMDLYCK